MQTKQQLIEENMALVYYIIHKYYPTFANDEDIVQCGMLGLCQAAETWDESKTLFSTYAGKCISYEIHNEFRRRKRQKGCLSLDYPLGDTEDDNVFGDLIMGDKDVDYVNVQPFYDKLKPREQEVFSLLYNGFTPTEVSNRLGIQVVTVCSYIRRLKRLWRDYYGEK